MRQIQQLADMKIATMEAGYKRLLDKLQRRGFQLQQVIQINKRRYVIAKGKTTSYLITYKKEPFFNFGKMFREQGQSGIGDTVNVEELKRALRNNVSKIYTIFPNGYVYSIKIGDFITDSFRWRNKEGKQVRSISIHKYKREVTL